MRYAILIAALLLASIGAFAQQTQPSLTDQLNSMRQAQDKNEEEVRQTQAAQRAVQQANERYMEQQKTAEKAIEDKRHAAALALQQQKQAEVEADKKRDQAYVDQLRSLDVQQKQLELEAEKAKVTRSNDYIDQDLKQKAAETDVIQSQADATRNVSSGAKTLMEKTGDAEVQSQSGWFK